MVIVPVPKFFNTLGKKKEVFKPRKGKKVQIFVCGPTVYDYSHLGHARTYTFYDSLVKFLRLVDYNVFYLQNITDIDDKIIARAKEKGLEPSELAKIFTKEYIADMKSLRVDSIDKYAPATNYIKHIVSQAKRLEKKGFAYTIKDGIYYNLAKFKDYGKLAGRKLVEAEDAQSRIDSSLEKKNKGDFCLWKFSKPGEPVWKTELGEGRPGWHIEDTAITETEFGPQYDIHGGAQDLIFPHHEAEIAQMEAVSGKKPLVKYWIHTGFLNVDGKKMSKSLGNFVTIRDALQGSTPEDLRYFFLTSHYRSSIDYNEKNLNAAKTALGKLNDIYNEARVSRKEDPKIDRLVNKYQKDFFNNIYDDFNTPKGLAVLFDLARELTKIGTTSKSVFEFLKQVDSIFNIFTKQKKAKISADVKKLAQDREKARKARDWKKSDKLRKLIETKGFLVEDTPQGPKIKPKS